MGNVVKGYNSIEWWHTIRSGTHHRGRYQKDFSEKIKMFKEMNIDAKLIRKSIAKYDSKSIVKKYIEIFDLIKI